MRKSFILSALLISSASFAQNNIGIGTVTPNASAALDVTSTTKGMLIPRLTTAQRTTIVSPATGLLVFDATTESFWFKSSTNWVELIDTSNNLLKKSGTNIYTTGNTQFGIGTSSPSYDLHIKQTNANIGLTDAATNKVSATITASDEDVIMNAYRSSGTGGNIILQRSSAIPALNAGNVGIGIPYPNSPAEKLQVNGNLRLQASDAALVLHSGSAERGTMYLSGNHLYLGTSPGNTSGLLRFTMNGVEKMRLYSGGQLTRPDVSGAADLLPIAYGKISSTGSVLNTTGNFTVSKTGTGVYNITLTDESSVYTNRNNYLILVTAAWNFYFAPVMANATIESDNTIEIRTNVPKVYYTNSSCSQSCGPFTYISNVKFYDEADNEFSFVIYKH